MESPPSSPTPGSQQARGDTVQELLAQITPRVWVTPAIAALIVIGFGVEIALGASGMSPTGVQLLAAGGDFGPSVAQGQWWRTVTSMFLHAGPLHLGFNLWAFWSMGKLTERVFGNVPFLAIYFLSGLGGSLLSLAWHPLSVGVGASGAVFGVYGAMLAFVLLHKGVFPPELLARQRNSLLGFIGYNVIFSLSVPNIDLAAHAGGLVTGLAAGALLGRDLLRPKEHVGRRALGGAALVAVLLLAGRATARRIDALPVVQAQREATEALAHLKARELPQAISLYSDAIAYERDPAWLSNRGLGYMWSDDNVSAQKDFREAHALEPTAHTRALLCEVGVRIGGNAETLEAVAKDCSDAIALDPKNASLLAYRGSVRDDQNRTDEAIADADAALQLDPSETFARAVRIDARLKQGKSDDAEPDCTALLGETAPRAFDFRICARVAQMRGDRVAERARLDACLVRAPADVVALFMRAALDDGDGRLQEAIVDYKAAVAAAPEDAMGWNNLAWTEALVGDFASARLHGDRAVSLAPDSGPAHGTRCFALVGLGLEADAKPDCARAVELTPDSTANATDRGMVAFLDKRYPDARRAWEEASRDPQRARELAPWLAKVPR